MQPLESLRQDMPMIFKIYSYYKLICKVTKANLVKLNDKKNWQGNCYVFT